MRITALTLALALVPAPVFAAKHCKKGKPCGNTCIAVGKTCHVGTGTTDGRTMDMFVLPLPPTNPPPTSEPPSTSSTSPTSGFNEASQAALECGRTHGAAPYQAITIELVVDDRGGVVSSSAGGVARTTALGRCIADAAENHFLFSTSEHALRLSRYTFVVGSPDSVETPTPTKDPAVAEPAPPQKQCRREDFENFDTFVECRVAEQGSSPAPVVGPPVDPAEQARQREAAEARAELGRKAKEQATTEAEEELRTRRTLLALVISGGVLDAAGIGLVAAAAGTGEPVADSFDAGPTCTIGKRCGDTCIAVEWTCHTPTGGGSFKSNPALLWPGVAALAVGSGLLVAALVIYRRNDSQASLIVNARGVGFR